LTQLPDIIDIQYYILAHNGDELPKDSTSRYNCIYCM